METQVPKRLPARRQMLRIGGMAATAFALTPLSGCTGTDYEAVAKNARLFGLGLVGVDFFPGNIVPYHGLSSMLAFLSGGIAAIPSFKITSTPFNYLGIVFGSIALITWFKAFFFARYVIGEAGTERWVTYPIMLWLESFGGYLITMVRQFFRSRLIGPLA